MGEANVCSLGKQSKRKLYNTGTYNVHILVSHKVITVCKSSLTLTRLPRKLKDWYRFCDSKEGIDLASPAAFPP